MDARARWRSREQPFGCAARILPNSATCSLEIDLMSAVPASATTSTTDPVPGCEFEHARQSPPAVFRAQIELPAHHRQHAHDRQPLRRRPLQKLRRRRFLAIGNIVDKAKCGDAAPLEGSAVRPDKAGAFDSKVRRTLFCREGRRRRDRPRANMPTSVAASARSAAAARRETRTRSVATPAGSAEEAAHVQRNDCHRTDYRTAATPRGCGRRRRPPGQYRARLPYDRC